VTAVLLKVTSDVAKEWNVKEGSQNQKQEGTSEDKNSEKRRECEGRGDDSIAPEVLGDVVPFTDVVLLRLVDGVQSESVNGLTRSVGQKNALPTLEGEENKEGDAVAAF
jgi:hypothetical protein